MSDIIRRRIGPRNGGMAFPRPAEVPKHHGPSIVADFAARVRCGEMAAKKRLESWLAMTRDLAAIVRTNPVHRDWFGRHLADAVAACAEPTATPVASLVEAHADEIGDTLPVLTRYAASCDPETAAVLRRELREDAASAMELSESLVRRHLEVVR